MSRHDTDWLSLLCGLVFTVLGLAYLIAVALHVHIPAIWTLSALLSALGVAGLIGTAQTRRRRRRNSA